jgi:opacity protein-like surface antigen
MAMAASSATTTAPAALPTSAPPTLNAEDSNILARAQEWLRSGQGRAAYATLEPREKALAGLPQYDYLLGESALAAGEPTRSAFAFERCLSVEPMNGACRLGMARAHMSLSEVAGARQELTTIAQSAPPPEVQKVVADYLGLLSKAEDANQDSRLAAYIELGMGYNSNINSATSTREMALPLLGGMVLQLSRDGRSRESGFGQATFNVQYSTPLATDWRFLLDANIAGTGNWVTHDYNTIVSNVSVGVARKVEKHQFIVKAQGQNYVLGGHSYRNVFGLLGQYAYSASDRSEFSAFAQASRMNYPDDKLRDAHRYTLGLSWSQALAGDRAVAYGSVYGGTEDAFRAGAPHELDYRYLGLRAGGMYLLNPRFKVEAGLGAERRDFDGTEFLFQKTRWETVYDAFVGAEYALSRKLSVRPQYRYAHSDSNIPLRDYQRHILSVNLRYELF